MINKEWLMSLNKQQRRRRKNKGKYPNLLFTEYTTIMQSSGNSLNNDKKYSFLGKRIKRGLYQSKEGKFLNADVNGSYNIMRKVVGDTIYKMVNSIEVCSMPYKFSVNF